MSPVGMTHQERLTFPPVEQARLAARAVSSAPTGPAASAPPRTTARALPGRLRVVIAVPRTDVGGGARILFEHANRLGARGHEVTVVSYFSRPEWFNLRAVFIQVPAGLRLLDAAPPCDLVVAGYWQMLPELVEARLAPVVHFEQGDFHLFEDLDPSVLSTVRGALCTADRHTAVSGKVAGILARRYDVESVVVPNAVDRSVFRVDDSPDAPSPPARRSVLCVGWDGNDFKGIDDVRSVAHRLRTSHPDVDVVWVTPHPPVREPGAIHEVVVAPAQDRLAALYRQASAYVCASQYESFPLPPMEAMASGTPVVTTANPGSLEYAVDGRNALVVPVGDTLGMTAALQQILDDSALAATLRAGGLETADAYRWEAILDHLERIYREVAEEAAGGGEVDDWTIHDPSAVPEDSEAADRLASALRRSGAEQLLVPVRHMAFEGHEGYRWQVLATRMNGYGTEKVFAPHTGALTMARLPYQDGIELFRAGRFGEAAAAFRHHELHGTDRSGRGALPRWLALCQFELGLPEEALQTTISGIQAFPDNPDHYYLAALIAGHLGYDVNLRRTRLIIDALGAGSRYSDFLAHPTGAFSDI